MRTRIGYGAAVAGSRQLRTLSPPRAAELARCRSLPSTAPPTNRARLLVRWLMVVNYRECSVAGIRTTRCGRVVRTPKDYCREQMFVIVNFCFGFGGFQGILLATVKFKGSGKRNGHQSNSWEIHKTSSLFCICNTLYMRDIERTYGTSLHTFRQLYI